jgi:hypothetical protein
MNRNIPYDHADPIRLGRAAARTIELLDDHWPLAGIARTLTAWWPDEAPRAGWAWSTDDVYMLARAAILLGAVPETSYDPSDLDAMRRLGTWVASYRLRHMSVHGDKADASIAEMRSTSTWR